MMKLIVVQNLTPYLLYVLTLPSNKRSQLVVIQNLYTFFCNA